MTKRVSILVSEETMARIKEEMARMMRAHEWGNTDASGLFSRSRNAAAEPVISTEAFLAKLLDDRKRKRERRAQSKLNRRKAGGGKRPKKAPTPD